MMKDTPYVHLFTTSQGFYLYDVNTDQVLQIPESFYHAMKADSSLEKAASEDQAYAGQLKKYGFLKSDRVQVSEHPMTQYVPYMLGTKLMQVTLQVTQRCDLRCEYCVYSGNYKNRHHSQKDMDWITAKKGIDLLIAHSSDSDMIGLGFYGGEPLLRFDLIQLCVAYIEEEVKGKRIIYNITTNGTIMNREIAQFLIDHDFIITLSLDGPEEIHDIHRRYADSNKGSFDTMMETVALLKEMHPDYHKKIHFNTVIDIRNEFKPLADFLKYDERVKDDIFMTNTIAEDYTDEVMEPSDSYIEGMNYEYFKVMLYRLGKISSKSISKLASLRFTEIQNQLFRFKENASTIGERNHHAGPCIPGKKRLFLSADGKLFPCERVSETSALTQMGDVDMGIDIEKAKRILNIECWSHDICQNCWAYRHCGNCIRTIDGITGPSLEAMKRPCEEVRGRIDSVLKDYCVLKDLGYDFYQERADELAGTVEGWT